MNVTFFDFALLTTVTGRDYNAGTPVWKFPGRCLERS